MIPCRRCRASLGLDRRGVCPYVSFDGRGIRPYASFDGRGIRPYASFDGRGIVSHKSRAEFRQVFPEELAAIDDLACSHVKQVHCEHSIFVVVAEDVRIVAFDARHALLLLQLLYRGDQVAILRGALVLL